MSSAICAALPLKQVALAVVELDGPGLVEPAGVVREPDALRIPAVLLRRAMQALDAFLESGHRVERVMRVVADREPAVAVAGGAAQRRGAFAPHPDRRMRLLHGLRHEADVGEPHVAALEARILLGPEDLERLEPFVGDPAALLEGRRIQGLELLLQPAGAGAEHHAAMGEHVDRGRDLRGMHGAAIGDDRHRGDQARLTADRRQPGQERELLEAGARAGTGPRPGRRVGIARFDVARHHHVVGDREMSEALLLGAAHDRLDSLRGGERAARRNGQSEVHDGTLREASDGEASC